MSAVGGARPCISPKDLLAVLALMLAVNAGAVLFLASERTLYHADLVAWWSFTRNLAQALAEDPWAAMVAVSSSVAHQTVNLLPATPLAPLLLLFGGSRLAYILAVVNLYGLPTMLALVFTVRRLAGACGDTGVRWSTAALVATMLLFSAIWQPVLLGYPDVAGVGFALLVLVLYLDRPLADQSVKRLLLVGFLVAFLLLFRRWYAFWSLAFCLALAGETALLVASRRMPVRAGLRACLAVAAGVAATLAILALPVTLSSLGTDYGDAFSAFKEKAGVLAELGAVVDHFGLLVLLVVAAAGVWLVWSRQDQRLPLFLATHAVLVFLTLRRVQDPDLHHWLLYLAAMMTLVGVAALRLLGRMPGRAGAVVVPLAAAGLLVAASAYSLPGTERLRPLTPEPVAPAVRGDLGEVVRLLGLLDGLVAQRPGYVYVLANGPRLNEQILAYANLSLGSSFRSPGYVLQAAHLDKRDGFPCTLVDATYVLVAWPVRPGSRAEEERVVSVPAESIVNGDNIGQAFHRLPVEVVLDGDLHVRLYERTRPLTQVEVDGLSRLLRGFYPDRPHVWEACQGTLKPAP